ncbi:ATP-dependent Clp protease ATP-binding subunit ClpA [Streptomyces sp. 3330]|uniref:Clp protease N-terminal domain-containing protein n=1 Tax=Streptomyces sp. 3330 TaxID=2817755 RepID=UPI002867045D|nr:Clp protease N-terminal domain-containing protein [Streptomyces sp. 3330]MDR6979558.1 ATP-dependent Clp protease ATP-binding subunit ClpA [Streptomyces sp. 3330]
MDDDPRLAAEPAAALAAARRRAVRDGDRQVDTAHLLHSLLEQDPQVRAAFDGGPQLARLLGYLVQRSIGYGLRWQSGIEDSRALAAVAVVEGLSPLAAAALEHACVRAAGRDGAPARGVDLLAAIVADPQARAVEVLTRAAVDVHELSARLEDGLQGRRTRPGGGEAPAEPGPGGC